MVTVKVDQNHPKGEKVAFDKAVRKFIKEVNKDKILEIAKEKQYYVKPSTKRRKQKVWIQHLLKLGVDPATVKKN